jgi:hypothetical protein
MLNEMKYSPLQFSVYQFDESLSLPEKLNKLFSMFKKIAENMDILNSEWLNILTWVTEELEKYSKEVIQEMIDNGTFDELFLAIFEPFKEETLKMIQEKFDELDAKLDLSIEEQNKIIEKLKADLDKAVSDMNTKIDEFIVKQDADFKALQEKFDTLKKELNDQLNEFMLDIDAKVKKISDDLGDVSIFRNWDKNAILKMKNEFTARKYNIDWFGATRNSDETVNGNYQAMTDAMKFISENGGGTLFFPRGTYRFHDHVLMKSKVSIEGDQAIFTAVKGKHSFCLYFDSYNGGGYLGGVQDVTIEGIIFQGNFDEGIYSIFNALHHAQNIIYRNCQFNEVNTNAHAIDLGGCKNILIEDCIFRGFNEQYYPDGRYAYLEAIQVDYSYYGGLGHQTESERQACDALPCENITVNRCQFLPITNSNGSIKYVAPKPIGTHTQMGTNPPKNIKFTNNLVRDCSQLKQANAWVSFLNVDNLFIQNNIFERTTGKTTEGQPNIIRVQTYESTMAPEQCKLDVIDSVPITKIMVNNVFIDSNVFRNFRSTQANASAIAVNGLNKEKSSIIGNNVFEALGIKITNNDFKDLYPQDTNPSIAFEGLTCVEVLCCDAIITGNEMRSCKRGLQADFSKIEFTNNILTYIFGCGVITTGCYGSISNNIFRTCIGSVYSTFFLSAYPSFLSISENSIIGSYYLKPTFNSPYYKQAIGISFNVNSAFTVSNNNFSLVTNEEPAVRFENTFEGKSTVTGNVAFGASNTASRYVTTGTKGEIIAANNI